MDSIFLNAGLAGGVALAALPVILHLFMKQTPKHVLFPALRLIQERQKRSRKRLKVKNWLLLLARIALIALMALALARPRLWSKASLGDTEVPTAMALVFDTSLSMGYEERGKTRLQEAKDLAFEILKKTHESSRVFVIDSAEPVRQSGLSPAGARKRIEALTIRAVNRPLNGAVGQAYKAVAGAEQPRHEVYVLTDLARTAWDLTRPAEGLEEVKKDKGGISTFVMRLSPKVIRNVAIVGAEPQAPFASGDEPLPILVTVRSLGPATKRVAEFHLDGKIRGKEPVNLTADGEAQVRFTTPKLTPGLHHGEISLAGEPDPLEVDDRRYFTLDVQPPLKVLVVSDRAIDADFVANALDPETLKASGAGRPFQVTRVLSPRLEGMNLNLRDYSCVFLLNVKSLPDSEWGRLNQYVRNGGGLVLALGDRVTEESLNDSVAAQLLPATIGPLKTFKDQAHGINFGKADIAHPLFERNTRDLLAELSSVPIYQYREVTQPQGTRTLLSYSDGKPALLERLFPGTSTGRVLLWTTALSRRSGITARDRRESWNDFPVVGWSFFSIINETVPYLAGVAGRQLTYNAGEDVRLPIDPSKRFSTFTIQGPGAKSGDTLGEPVSGGTLFIPAPPRVGPWTVTASRPDGGTRQVLGFSVNPPPDETKIVPMTEADLTAVFGGKDRYQLADDTKSLNRVVKNQRVGRELFPLLMLLILLVVSAENVLANTFYRERSTAGAQRAAA
jgi:hypothetical protein